MSTMLTKSGILVPLKNRGKENKLIPWAMINKEKIKPAIQRCTAPKHGIDIYIVDKKIDGKRLEAVFKTEREALKAVDIFLIENGREPEYILRRQ